MRQLSSSELISSTHEVSPTWRKKALDLGKKSLIGSAGALVSAGMALSVGEAIDHRPAEPAHVTIMPGLPTAERPPDYNDQRLFLFIGGFARPVGETMAKNASPVASEFGKVAYLTTNPKNLDKQELVEAFESSILPLADNESDAVELVVGAQSAGAKMILPALNEFIAKHQDEIDLKLAIIDSAPHDGDDVRSGLPKMLVEHPETVFGGYPVILSAQIYSLTNDFPHQHSIISPKTWNDAAREAGNQRTPGLRAQLRAIDEPIASLDGLTHDNPEVIYTRPTRPEVDNLIDTASAFEKWYAEFEKYGITLSAIAIDSTSHAALVRGGNDTAAYNSAFQRIFTEQFGESSS